MKGICAATGKNWRFKDIAGKRFHRLTVVSYKSTTDRGMAMWNCLCDCGKTSVVTGAKLRNGHIKSCGCYKGELASKRRTTHGLSGTCTYHSWADMKDRCYRAKNSQFKYYGARGITVCERWRDSFSAFLEDMGECLPGLSIERINTNGNYEPGNCKWATPIEQANNKRSNRFLTIGTVTKTLAQWQRYSGLGNGIIANRIKLGWAIEDLLKPVCK